MEMSINNFILSIVFIILTPITFLGVNAKDICDHCGCQPRHIPHSQHDPKSPLHSDECVDITNPEQCVDPNEYGLLCLWICDGVELEDEMYSDVTFIGFVHIERQSDWEDVSITYPKKLHAFSNEFINMNEMQYIQNMAVRTLDLCSGVLYELSLNQHYFMTELHRKHPRRLVAPLAGDALTSQTLFKATGLLEFDGGRQLPSYTRHQATNTSEAARRRTRLKYYWGVGTAIANEVTRDNEQKVHVITAGHNAYNHEGPHGARHSTNFKFWMGLDTTRTRTVAGSTRTRPSGTPAFTRATRIYYSHYSGEAVRRGGIVDQFESDWAIVTMVGQASDLAHVGVWTPPPPPGGVAPAHIPLPDMKIATYDRRAHQRFRRRVVNFDNVWYHENLYQNIALPGHGHLCTEGMSGSPLVLHPTGSNTIYGIFVGEDQATHTEDLFCRITTTKFNIILRETGLRETVVGGERRSAAHEIYDNLDSQSFEYRSNEYNDNNGALAYVYDDNYDIIEEMAFINIILFSVSMICLLCAFIICWNFIALGTYWIFEKYAKK